jgi:anti-sigma factor RsiW
MKCAAAREWISDYVDGNLDPGREAEIKAHLEDCRECRELAADFAAIVRGAKSLGSLEPSPAVWPRITARVKEARPEAPARPRERRSWLQAFWKHAGWVYAGAAALVLVIAGGIIVRQGTWSNAGLPKEGTVEFTLARLQEAQGYYDKAIQALGEAVKSRESGMDPRLAEVFNVNLAAMDDTIQACRQIVEKDPDNLAARAYLLTAYREKVNFLEEIMGAERSAVPDKSKTTI